MCERQKDSEKEVVSALKKERVSRCVRASRRMIARKPEVERDKKRESQSFSACSSVWLLSLACAPAIYRVHVIIVNAVAPACESVWLAMDVCDIQAGMEFTPARL